MHLELIDSEGDTVAFAVLEVNGWTVTYAGNKKQAATLIEAVNDLVEIAEDVLEEPEWTITKTS